MKAVILAGGRGTRFSEETETKPKPMIEIGGRPILWHIMKIYAAHGVGEFIICCGYRGYQIKEYFSNYMLHTSDVTFDMKNRTTVVHEQNTEPWKVTLVDTGDLTNTGGRLKRIARYLGDDTEFCFTYGDGVSDVDIRRSIEFHGSHGRLATVTSVLPPARFGSLARDGAAVSSLIEKPQGDQGWINGGFFVLSTPVLERIAGDATSWERETLNGLARDDQLRAFDHTGFWHPMDTIREKEHLDHLWATGKAPWRIW